MPKIQPWESAINYFDALLKTADLYSVSDYAKYLHISSTSVRDRKQHGLRHLRNCFKPDIVDANPDFIYSNLIKSFPDVNFELKLTEYINAQNPNLWNTVPHKNTLPSPYEMIEFLIKTYWNELLGLVKSYTTSLPSYHSFNFDYIFNMYKSKWSVVLPYRVRYYDFFDLPVKQVDYTNTEFESVSRSIAVYNDIHRIVVLKKSAFADEWNIVKIIGNNKNYSNVCSSRNAEWQVTYYDYKDNVIKRDILPEYTDCDKLSDSAYKLNAMYFVLSHRAPRSNNDFIIQYYSTNSYCSSSAAALAIEKYIIKQQF